MLLYLRTFRSKVCRSSYNPQGRPLTHDLAWIRIVFAEGPRNVVNALTLYSVVQAKLVPNGPSHDHAPIAQFFVNLRILANSSRIQAVVLGGMAWTLVVWTFRALNLLIAVVLYLVFLWHHIPANDGGLTGYLTRKVDAKVRKIVAVKVQKALDKENADRDAEEAKALKDGNGKKLQPTVPTLDGFGSTDELVKNSGPNGQYQSESSLPSYSSRRSSQTTIDRQLNPLDDPWGPFPITRTNTLSSNSTSTNTSYRSNTPLINNNNGAGTPYGASAYSRSNTIKSDRSLSPVYGGGGGEMMYNPPGGAPRGMMTPMGRNSPALPQEFRQGTPLQMGYGQPMGRGPLRPGMDPNNNWQSSRNVVSPIDSYSPVSSSASMGMPMGRGRGSGPPPIYNPRTRPSPGPGPGPTYAPYGNPNDSSLPPPRRNMTAPLPPQPPAAGGMYFPPQPTPRSTTAPLPGGGYEDLEMQVPARAGTAGGMRGNGGGGWGSSSSGRGRGRGRGRPFEGAF
jgi:Fungal potassium channel